jgi:hypothetical protein
MPRLTSLFPFFEKEFKRLDIKIQHSAGDPLWVNEKADLQQKFDEYVKNRRG